MSLNTRYNKKQSQELLKEALSKNTYPHKSDKVLETYPYTLDKNRERLKKLRSRTRKQWFAENKQQIEIWSWTSEVSNHSQRISHHYDIAIHKWEELFSRHSSTTSFPTVQLSTLDTAWKFVNFVDSELKKLWLEGDDLYQDILVQVNSMKQLFQEQAEEKNTVTSITISHELNPLNICMMWDWVEGSCLAKSSWTGNNYSVFTNALEVNKSVFYIRDQNGGIIGRVLVAIDRSKKVLRFPMYYSGTSIDLDPYFDTYLEDLVEKSKLSMWWKVWSVDILICESRYKDPQYKRDLE